jgi:hypothetical protein
VTKRQRNRRRIAAASVLALGLGVGGYAFTAANTVAESKAGDGSGEITGYDVSEVDYTLNATDPSTIDSVDFTLDTEPTAGSDVMVQLDSTGGEWHDCTWTGTAASCDTTGESVLDADNLRVVIAD